MPPLKPIKVYRHTTNYYRVVKNAHRKIVIDADHSKWLTSNEEPSSQNYLNCFTEENPPTHGGNFEETDLIDESCDIYPDALDNCEYSSLSEKLYFSHNLKLWALSHKLTLSCVTELLHLLRADGKSELPKDARTFLRTPLVVSIEEVGTGKYWYNGIEKNIINSLSNVQTIPDCLSLVFNVDGISPFNSSSHQFWPILFRIDELHFLPPMVAAIYYGENKPALKPFFSDFIREMNYLSQTGIIVRNKIMKIGIKYFVCDTQARSFIKGTPACNAEYGSCIKCTVVGEWDHRGRHMSYPRFHCPRRTDESFREKTDEDHHKEDTPLTELPINMVEDFIIADALHLFDLGIMRRCLFGWREGSYNFHTKLSKRQADLLSEMLENANRTKPRDIQRAIRNLKCLKFWKGSEYRTFLLYLGPVVLKEFLPQDIYEHFLILHCAVTILSCNKYLKYLHIAEKLLEEYVELFIEIYGIDSISSNIHNVCHVVDDVRKFGTLSNISTYPFENYLGYLKSLVRHGNLPLSQIAKRVIEMSYLTKCSENENDVPYVSRQDTTESHQISTCKHVYKEVHVRKNLVLSADNKNNYYMTKNKSIVSMINATYFNENIHIYGKEINNKHDFFIKPFASSQLNVFASKGERTESMEGIKYQCKVHKPKLYVLDEIMCKLFCIQYNTEFVFFPLLHTLEENT